MTEPKSDFEEIMAEIEGAATIDELTAVREAHLTFIRSAPNDLREQMAEAFIVKSNRVARP